MLIVKINEQNLGSTQKEKNKNETHKTETNNGEFPNGRHLGHGVRNRGHRHGLLETGAACPS
jgi:hypothetical protein